MALSTNESVGATSRLSVLRLGASRLSGVVTVDNLDKDLDGTYGWKRLDDGTRDGAPELSDPAAGKWTVTRGSV